MNNITRAKLEKLYYTTKTEDLAKKLEMSVPTLIKILKGYGIELKGKNRRLTKSKLIVKI